MDSKIGLIIQLAGVSLITLLTLFLRRSLKVVALVHWTHAWLFMSFALFCLRLAFSYDEYSTQLFSFYFLTQYVFGFFLIAGCRSLGDNGELPIRQEILILPFILIAFALPFVAADFNLVFNLHSLLLSGFFAMAFYELWRTKIRSFGWKVMLVALGLLVADFVQYFVAFSMRQYFDFPAEYLMYNSIIDLVLQILLGFGMVIVLLELVLSDAKIANEKLRAAHEKLEGLVHIDPLTTALNRHAFHGYVKRHAGDDRPSSGSVGFFDIDNLKTINDIYGHAVGDIAIRAVVRAIREIVRSEDLIFRWGGDEFFIIMIGLDADAASVRMAKLETMLSDVRVEGVHHSLSIGVSHAFEDFADIADLEATIQSADAKMYRQKQMRKMAPTPQFMPSVAVEDTQLIQR
ncbi:MAG: GGDEF domain-containing protein [Pyrinomonadaceae bacterium]|nr:GGDEF domain-containing protein [Pyrinomonadaceae bacterium]MBP6211417.1 GGDEF domain-containing protein [Pyrinomonadaceae bacterium]